MALVPQALEMATSVTTESKKRKRRKNFTVEEESVIESMYQENAEILTQKFSNEVTNRAKIAIWLKITDCVNTKGISLRTVDQVKEKWGNMAQKAKKTFTEYRLQQKKTGGGPPPPEMSQTTSRIIESMKDTASFSGVPGGIDSEIIQNESLYDDSTELASVPVPEPAVVPSTSQVPIEIVCLPVTQAPAPAPAPVEPTPSSSATVYPSPSIIKKAKKKRYSQEDVLAMQYKVLEGQLHQQDLENNKTNLELQKLALQIELLQRLLTQQEFDANADLTKMFKSMFG